MLFSIKFRLAYFVLPLFIGILKPVAYGAERCDIKGDFDVLKSLIDYCEQRKIPDWECDQIFEKIANLTHEESLVYLKSYQPHQPTKTKKFQVQVGDEFEVNSVTVFSVSKDASRGLRSLDPAENRNYQEFLRLIANPTRGLMELRKLQGKWQLEKIASKGLLSIRLGHDKRVLFRLKGEQVEIYQVGKNVDTH